ncbi:MAG: hypothetical protein PHH24_00700 [Candidatus Moranbacteria bacterium]|nr:hypothetical protein [Candidatus Moranbacteria bacterium]MDD5652385.1 hypothetical protein [Candidatus Moranbacteria bacterium]
MELDKNKKLLIYKILEIIIFLAFFVWSAALLAESILPGLISAHLSFLRLAIFSLILIVMLSALGKILGLSFDLKIKKWHCAIAAIFGIIIISLSLIKFHWSEIIIITTTSLFIIYYFFKVLFIDN